MNTAEKQTLRAPRPNPDILKISPYVQGKSAIPGKSEPIKLSSNESSFGPSPKAIAAYEALSSSLYRYPDGSQEQLREAIAGVYSLDSNKIICGNGSDELLDLIARIYLQPGDEVILSTNHFVMCSLYATIQGAEVVLAEEEGYKTLVDDLLSKVTDQTKMITLANPNNPTGTYLSVDEIRKIHTNIPPEVLLIIDGAYAEYVMYEDYESGTALVEENENVIVTRTFSKIFGLSALRVGWAYCPLSIIDVLQRIRSPFNVNNAAMTAAIAAVQDQPYLEKVRQHTHDWLRKIETEIGGLGITVVPSAANFYLLDFSDCGDKTAQAAGAYLEQSGIIPRPVGSGGANVIRITVGLDEENEAVITCLREFMAE